MGTGFCPEKVPEEGFSPICSAKTVWHLSSGGVSSGSMLFVGPGVVSGVLLFPVNVRASDF